MRRLGPIVGVFAAGLLSAGCVEKNKFVPPPPPKVTVAQPLKRDVVEYVEFPATTRAVATVSLRSRVSGYLKEIAFSDGDTVKEGDLLFVIEPEPYEVARTSAQASLEKAKASLLLAETELRRTQELRRSNSIAEAEVDAAVANRNSAAADVAAAEASVKKAQLDLDYTRVTAPINGRTGRHLVDKGNLVQAETTELATVESIDPIYVFFQISEADYFRFMELRRQNVIPDPAKVPIELQVGLPNEVGFPHVGKLDYLDLGVDAETGTLLRRGIFPNPDGTLVPGLFVRIRAALGKPVPRLLVEERALAADQRGDYLFVVGKDNVVEYRPVKLGALHDGKRVIETGVHEGDWVIVNGIQRARPGATVDPTRQTVQDVAADAN